MLWSLLQKLVGWRCDDPQGTLLHQAVIDDQPDHVDHLVAAGVDPAITNYWGYSAIEMARLLGRQECAQRLGIPSYQAHIKLRHHDDNELRAYSITEFEKRMGISWLPALQFASWPVFRAAIRSGPWWIKQSGWGRESRWLGHLLGKELAKGTFANVSIQWISDELGYGLFADAALRSGDFVGEYTGVVRQRYRRQNYLDNDFCLIYPTSRFWPKVFMIDASETGNYGRYINHSDKPNLQLRCLVNRSMLHVTLHALRDIHRGDQLTFDYGAQYWYHRPKPVSL